MAGIKMVTLVVLGHVRILQDITRILFRFNKIYSIKKCQMVVDKETFGSSTIRVGVNSAPELDFLANSKSNSGIELELELALPSPGGIGIELELPSFELELESELHSLELNSELPSWN